MYREQPRCTESSPDVQRAAQMYREQPRWVQRRVQMSAMKCSWSRNYYAQRDKRRQSSNTSNCAIQPNAVKRRQLSPTRIKRRQFCQTRIKRRQLSPTQSSGDNLATVRASWTWILYQSLDRLDDDLVLEQSWRWLGMQEQNKRRARLTSISPLGSLCDDKRGNLRLYTRDYSVTHPGPMLQSDWSKLSARAPPA
jgi:hypothetical protein